MFRTLMTALRRRRTPPPPPSRAVPVGARMIDITADPSEFIDRIDAVTQGITPDQPAPLPHRTPGLAAARRHAWTGVHHSLGALRAVAAWTDVRYDPARGSEADVTHLAALHQIDTALAELAAARAALTRSTR
ncbi:hypothetical protein [Nocardiopsis sp. FR26]|uniref:hypothetical protein n=1 Tax=Nocardiopsis sp. FR26 TaxID=2605987 RepID=UPI00135CA64D|nr:hypothetical protein [Nocardiopsis sp. FR26]